VQRDGGEEGEGSTAGSEATKRKEREREREGLFFVLVGRWRETFTHLGLSEGA